MPPKKATSTPAKKSAPSHASYQDMIRDAIVHLKDRAGSSRQALKKYVQMNNNLAGVTELQFTTQFNRALQKGSESGVFSRPKGTSGPVKLAKPTKASTESKTASKPASAKTATKKTTSTTVPKKSTSVSVPAKKASATTATKKAPTKKAATTTKSKANTSKVRKTPTAAPAVEEKAPVVLGKTKSGRVTKSKAPQPAKTGAKKTATKKAAAPKKA